MSIRDTLAAIGRLAEFRTARQRAGDKKRAEKLRRRRKKVQLLSRAQSERIARSESVGAGAWKGIKKGAATGLILGTARGFLDKDNRNELLGKKQNEKFDPVTLNLLNAYVNGGRGAIAGGIAGGIIGGYKGNKKFKYSGERYYGTN